LYWTAPTFEFAYLTYDKTDDAMLVAGNDYFITITDTYGDGWGTDAEFEIGDLVLIDSTTGSFLTKYFSISIDENGNVYDNDSNVEVDECASYNLPLVSYAPVSLTTATYGSEISINVTHHSDFYWDAALNDNCAIEMEGDMPDDDGVFTFSSSSNSYTSDSLYLNAVRDEPQTNAFGLPV